MYSLCATCNVVMEKLMDDRWSSIDGSYCSNVNGHTVTDSDDYRSEKFGDDIRTEILYSLGLMGWAEDSLGDAESFGYYELFPEFCAIVRTNSYGFVDSYFYDSEKFARNAWAHIETDYDEWCGEQEEYEYCYSVYASDDASECYDPYADESDIYDCSY